MVKIPTSLFMSSKLLTKWKINAFSLTYSSTLGWLKFSSWGSLEVIKLMYGVAREGGCEYFLQGCTVVAEVTSSSRHIACGQSWFHHLLPVGFCPKFPSFLCLAAASTCAMRIQARLVVWKWRRGSEMRDHGRADSEGLSVWEVGTQY